nr:arginine--tRNA ligase, chloroplastic/mitochondrial [Tanacetum cinerariifolium]
ALEESCLTVMLHILCEYLYDLSEKFNNYYFSSSAFKTSSFFDLSITQLPSSSLFSASRRSVDVNARELPRNSRFELLSFRTAATRHFRSGEEEDRLGKLFGLISVSDKYGLVSDGGSQFFEPDFAHVPIFNHDWDSPINMVDWETIYLGNSTSCHSVPFASSLEIHMELYVTKGKNTCYQLCNHKEEIDLSDFWNKESDSARGHLTVESEDGPIYMFYFLLKDAVDASLEVEFRTETLGRKVRGYVLAYYGDDFLYESRQTSVDKICYMAVPTKGNLIIKAYLEDAGSGEVIMKNSCKFKPQLKNCSSFGTISWIEEEDCDLDLTVDWKYQAFNTSHLYLGQSH